MLTQYSRGSMTKQPSNELNQPQENNPSATEAPQEKAQEQEAPSVADMLKNEVQEETRKFQDLVNKAGETAESKAANAEAELAEENAKLKDQLLRAMADTENTRKRAKQQVEDAAKFAISSFAKDLINVLDNFYRATESLEQVDTSDSSVAALKEGVDLTMGAFLKVCDNHGIVRLYPEGEAFDHNLHQAIAQVPSADHANGTVIQVMQAGYMLKDRLLRPAMVTVAKEAE